MCGDCVVLSLQLDIHVVCICMYVYLKGPKPYGKAQLAAIS